ncbi:MAG: hypothetical protein GY845_27610 [Planctomycetes bacterium]|nr:hypothetical protein [Planctomycetota bacterium]
MKRTVWTCEVCHREAFYRYPFHWLDMRVIKPGRFEYHSFCSPECLQKWVSERISCERGIDECAKPH